MSDQPTIYVQCGFRELATGLHIPRARVKVFENGVQVEFHLQIAPAGKYTTEQVWMKETWRKFVWDGEAWKLTGLDTLISWAYESLITARREARRAEMKDGK